MNDLSEAQKYLYDITRGIQVGHFPNCLKERKIGPPSNSGNKVESHPLTLINLGVQIMSLKATLNALFNLL